MENYINKLRQDPTKSFLVQPDGEITYNFPHELSLYPGSFNPLHAGHQAIYDCILNDNKAYEISLNRVGKLAYSDQELINIIKQFEWKAPLVVTNAPTILDKIYLLYQHMDCRVVEFHAGYDSAERLRDHYGLFGIQMIEATFVVYDRMINNKIESIKSWKHIPRNVYKGADIPENLLGLSSTILRGL